MLKEFYKENEIKFFICIDFKILVNMFFSVWIV